MILERVEESDLPPEKAFFGVKGRRSTLWANPTWSSTATRFVT